MSQVTQPRISLPTHLPRRSTAWIAGLLALVAVATVALVLALGGDSSQDAGSLGAQAQPSLRAGGGPEESGVAATLGSRPAGGPDESSTAASISGR